MNISVADRDLILSEFCDRLRSSCSSVFNSSKFVDMKISTLDFGAARKMRVNLPDSSGLILQSFCPANGKPHPGQPRASTVQATQTSGTSEKHPTYIRRYSTSQEEAEDKFDSDKVLQKFNSTLATSAYRYHPHGSGTANIYSKDDSHESLNTVSSSSNSLSANYGDSFKTSNLSRVQSSPHLSLSSLSTTFLGRPRAPSSGSDVDGEPSSNMVSKDLRRPQSQNNLLQVAHLTSGSDDSSRDKERASNKQQIVALSGQSEAQKSASTDMTDSGSSGQHGYGILSRTRQFGAWLTKATEGEKVEVTKKDLNVFAPTSF